MQKKFIVLAIAALASGSAFAADTTVYGVLDAAVGNVSGSGVKGAMLAVDGGLAGSRLGVKAVEELDGGMKAIAVVEFGLATETSNSATTTPTITSTTTVVNAPVAAVPVTSTTQAATTASTSTGVTATNLAARQQLLGLAGSFGTVATGYLQTTGYDFGIKYDAFGGSSVSALQNVTGSSFLLGAKGGAARAQRALAYISPDISGLTFAVNYSTALTGLGDAATLSTAAATGVTATLLSANYVAGPLSAGAAYISLGGASNATEMGLGVSYDLGVAKVLASYQSNASTSVGTAVSVTSTAYGISGVVPVGTDAVVLGIASNTLTTANTSATGMSLGYLHPMSKTMTAYAAYSSVTNGSASATYSVANSVLGGAGTVGASSSLIGAGLNKKF